MNFLVYDGEILTSEDVWVQAKIHFSSEECYKNFVDRKIYDELGITLMNPSSTLQFWFDSLEQKSNWLQNNLKKAAKLPTKIESFNGIIKLNN